MACSLTYSGKHTIASSTISKYISKFEALFILSQMSHLALKMVHLELEHIGLPGTRPVSSALVFDESMTLGVEEENGGDFFHQKFLE